MNRNKNMNMDMNHHDATMRKLNAETQYRGMKNAWKKKGILILENREESLLSSHFTVREWSMEVNVKINPEKESVLILTYLPVLCRPENAEKLKLAMMKVNDNEKCGFGRFMLEDNRIKYVYAFSYKGQTVFNEEAFENYVDDCVIVPYMYADELADIATEHLNIPAPDPLSWMDDELFREPIITDSEDEYSYEDWPKEEEEAKNREFDWNSVRFPDIPEFPKNVKFNPKW